jgi:hypothetical protein
VSGKNQQQSTACQYAQQRQQKQLVHQIMPVNPSVYVPWLQIVVSYRVNAHGSENNKMETMRECFAGQHSQ